MAENLEQELSRLEEEYGRRRAEIKEQIERGEVRELPPEKETLREVVEEQTGAGAAPIQPAPQPAAPPPSGTELTEMERRVQEFVNIAFEKTIGEAAKEVRATHNPALIDAFHDTLVDQLYDQLVERGKIKELKSVK
jgi:hypothetical protein